MPKIYRSMLEDACKPKVGSQSKMLGVRVAPNPHPDIPVDSNGHVHPGTGGMSVAPDWRTLPFFLVPERLRSIVPRARGSNDLKCWSLGEGAFKSDALSGQLALRVDDPQPATHGLVEPATEMTISEFQIALARTRDQWTMDEV